MSDYRSRITGVGSYFPDKVLTNAFFESYLDTSDEWIRSRTGIQTRRVIDTTRGESTGTMALEAANKALAQAGISGSELDLIIVGTVTPDSVMPTTANNLQRALGATGAFTFDLQAACSGFLYALSIGDQYVRTGAVKKALVIGAESLSTVTDYRDRKTCILFGDGAGAAVLERTQSTEHCVVDIKLRSDGGYGDLLKISHGYSKMPTSSPDFKINQHKIQMQGAEVFKIAVRNMIECSQTLLKDNGLTTKDLDFVFVHQANIRIIDLCLKTLEIPREKTWINIDKYGNTSAATLPGCLDEAWTAGAVKPGDLVLMSTFGGGLTWGSALIRL